jgi:hypothetical protein
MNTSEWLHDAFLLEKGGTWSRRASIFSFAAMGLVASLFIYLSVTDRSMIWQDVYAQFANLLLNPERQSQTAFQNSGSASDAGIFALLGLLYVGFYNVLSKAFSRRLDLIAISFFLTLIATGVIGLLLGLLHLLYPWVIISAVLMLAVALNAATISRLKSDFGRLKETRGFPKFNFSRSSIIIIVPLALSFGFSFFYSVTMPITDFDALIYHAQLAKIMFEEHSIPVFSGPSIGIEISGNYPPLFSAISAGLYTLFGRFDDVMLRVLPALFGLPLALGVYRISERVFPSSGRYSLLLILSTPLFIHNLVISSPTSLISTCIVLAVYSVLNFDAVPKDRRQRVLHLILGGVFMGAALLSSYQSLFYIAIPLITLLILLLRRGDKRSALKICGSMILIALLIGSIWYVRNYAYHENPFYPWLFSPKGDEAKIFEETEKEIQTVGSIITFGRLDYDVIDIRTLFRFHPVLFPAFSAVSMIGILMLLYKSPARFSWLAVWMTLPILLIFSLGTVFPRYLLPLLPPLIVSFGFMVAYAAHNNSYKKVPFRTAALGLLLLLYALVGLPVAMSNPAVNVGNFPDKTFFIKHAGDRDLSIQVFYDGDVEAWQWIREHAGPYSKVATFDPRTYYMGNYSNILPLDGREAIPLYSMTDPDEMKDFLREHRIEYIFDASSPNSRLYYMMPLTSQLGSDEYPEVFSPGFARVYKVD